MAIIYSCANCNQTKWLAVFGGIEALTQFLSTELSTVMVDNVQQHEIVRSGSEKYHCYFIWLGTKAGDVTHNCSQHRPFDSRLTETRKIISKP
jgi:hypothetical protein